MANVIKIKRGNSANLDSLTLQEGELATTTDTRKLYIGNADGTKTELGQQGPQGVRGTKWWVGDFYSQMFDDANNGDLLLNTSETSPGEVLQFDDGTWNPVSNIRGPQGPQGEKGSSGEGVPAGGTTGQILAKASNADNDAEWVDQIGRIIYEETLTSNKNNINISGLNSNGSIKELEITLESYGSENAEFFIFINGVSNRIEYCNSKIYMFGDSSTVAGTVKGGYYPRSMHIGGQLYATLSDYPSITKMRIFYTPRKGGNGGKISYMVDHASSFVDQYSQVHITGVMQSDYDSINSVMFKFANSTRTFLADSRVTVRKVR